MQRELCAYLQDLLDASDAIATFTAGMEFTAFETNDLVRSAVERKFEILGEALRQASTLYPGELDSIQAMRQVIGQRNHLAHGYFAIDPLILWDAATKYLPMFRKEVSALFKARCVPKA